MLKVALADLADGKVMFSEEASNGECVLVTEPFARVNSMFYSASRSTLGITTIVTPKLGASIVLTDLIISYEKVASAALTLRFNDGTRSVDLASVTTTDAPANIAIPFSGRIKGWKDAWVEMETTKNGAAFVMIGFYYVNASHTLAYTEWLAERQG
jgi:hypothetical protein